MRILFDQATPVPIRQYLEGHVVRTAAQQGWDTLKNGELLLAAEQAGFDLLLTPDKNMRYQQNLKDRKMRRWGADDQRWAVACPDIARRRQSRWRSLAISVEYAVPVPCQNLVWRPRQATSCRYRHSWFASG